MSEPAYRAVASVLRKEIQEGRWKPKQQLPTGRELQERFGVSTTTIKAAIAELTRENLVAASLGASSTAQGGTQ